MSRSMGDKPGVVNLCHKLYCEISPDVNSESINLKFICQWVIELNVTHPAQSPALLVAS